MSRLDALRRVAGLLGIATNHVDAFGIRHEVNEETLSRLIAAIVEQNRMYALAAGSKTATNRPDAVTVKRCACRADCLWGITAWWSRREARRLRST